MRGIHPLPATKSVPLAPRDAKNHGKLCDEYSDLKIKRPLGVRTSEAWGRIVGPCDFGGRSTSLIHKASTRCLQFDLIHVLAFYIRPSIPKVSFTFPKYNLALL